MIRVGFATDGRTYIEVGYVVGDSVILIAHAMPARQKYLP